MMIVGRARRAGVLALLTVVAFLSVAGLLLRLRGVVWPLEFYLETFLSLSVFLLPIPPRLLTLLGLLSLSFSPFLLSFGNRLLADRLSVLAFIFLGGGVLRALLDLYHRGKEL